MPGFLLVIMCGATLFHFGYRVGTAHYQRDLLLAKEGMQHLWQGKERLFALALGTLDTQSIARTQQEFVRAVEIFTHIEDDLRFIPTVAASLPWYGHRIHSAQHLVPLALALAQAGIASCDVLNVLAVRLYHPFSTQAHGLMVTDLPMLTQNIHAMQASVAQAVDEAAQLQSSDVQDAGIPNVLNIAHSDLPKLQHWLDGMVNVFSIAPAILGIGAPIHYLVEILDATELRPGGGFIGNYGILTLSEGRLVSTHITDTDLLDQPFYASGRGIPFPQDDHWFDIARGNWGLRDSNLSADFPTNARNAESMYQREGGDTPLQGVIAITPALIQSMLAVIGPISLPEYHETVNAGNLIERIHYHQLGRGGEGPDYVASSDGYSSLRKHFVALLAHHFVARVRQVGTLHILQFFRLLADALQTKDLQLYINDPKAEMLLHRNHLDAAIQASRGDDLFVVDANIGANKANHLIKNMLSDTISIDEQGNATHHMMLHYAWTTRGSAYGLPLYRDYVHIYVPRGSVLKRQIGWQPRGTSSDAGHMVWAGFFTLSRNQTHTITLTWSVPHAAVRNGDDWRYHPMLQKQAGAVWITHIQILLPTCAAVKGAARGRNMLHTQTAIFDFSLVKNTALNVPPYVCPK
ncbi:hypothetical protein KDH_28090 [Dictyobacter sp. S3.2.2.5]|uniref:DUF4012 domain-containing protein n=1 Tax=Dictyobacter halimunensis TaxID=3026934 RepID=A0ABQ6FQK5_9CHLR|nr:hypothetical protein KDH_28090 [Dictyobacter sp. S3.2.2.5]